MEWTDEYREIVEFYYWEPQHIGRAKGVKRFNNADEMYDHVNKLEVSLNHVTNILFSLYPLYKLDCFNTADESHIMMSAWQLELLQREQKNATQPDLFFKGKDKNIAIELKTNSKSNLDQILKYINFNKSILGDDKKEFELIFLTPQEDVSKIFKEKFKSSDDIYLVLKKLGLKIPKITFVSYDQLYQSLVRKDFDNDMEKKLITGYVNYLTKRPELAIKIK